MEDMEHISENREIFSLLYVLGFGSGGSAR